MNYSARVSGSHQKTTTDTKARKPNLLIYQFHCESLTYRLGYKRGGVSFPVKLRLCGKKEIFYSSLLSFSES